VRRALRAGPALSGLGVFLSGDRERGRDLLAQIARHPAHRFGGDYRNLDIAPDPTGKSCAAACVGEAQCRAWTYARPGYVGTSATCFLKDRVTSPQHRPCCISGVVR